MKKFIICCAVFILAFCASSCMAAEWVEAERNPEYLCYIDKSSIKLTGDTFRVWEKWICRSKKAKKDNIINNKLPEYIMTYTEYNLNEPMFRVISNNYYSNNSVIGYSEGDYKWAMSPPQTCGETVWHHCRHILGYE